jgi:hypothetical protein
MTELRALRDAASVVVGMLAALVAAIDRLAEEKGPSATTTSLDRADGER